jgi:uncharacterized protein (DUF2249 family)
MEVLEILDVTVIEPRFKHPTIFDKFDSLLAGEAFIIHNDHDPKPLYYQLLAERGQIFVWDYVENGPELWQVKIAKKSNEENAETIGEIVAKDYRKAQVFKNMGIDFCCDGKKNIAEVCEKKGIDPEEVEHQLSTVKGENSNSETDFQKWDLGFLSDYIINTHHRYLRENTAFILEIAQKVARVHGDFDVTIDMDTLQPLSQLKVRFMQSTGPGVYIPAQVTVAVSEDGKVFKTIQKEDNDVPYTDSSLRSKTFAFDLKGNTARYIRITGKKEKRGFMFTDEVVVY